MILSATSQYFQQLFASGMKECHEGTVQILSYPTELFSKYLDYCYSGTTIDCFSSEKEVHEMFLLADYLADTKLKHQLYWHMVHTTKPEHLVEHLRFLGGLQGGLRDDGSTDMHEVMDAIMDLMISDMASIRSAMGKRKFLNAFVGDKVV